MYSWEDSGKKRTKVKRTGTVVLHNNETIDPSFDRLLKPHIHAKNAADESEVSADDSTNKKGVKAPLMTENTVAVLKGKQFRFEQLLPSQAQCYRGIFNGRDVILHSRTGSGKTLAYALPVIERHLIFDANRTRNGPFCLIFVFSDELAFQTRDVLQSIYKKLRFGIAGQEDFEGAIWDVVIGTVVTLDEAIRGRRRPQKHANKRPRADAADSGSDQDDEEAINASDDDDDEAADAEGRQLVDVSGVRSIVVDEVDTTLGPRFSSLGRRMKALLKTIRIANGSLSESLMTDFHAHHYVLCGATIPNWVIKAGFLGQKKYYYQLVHAGSEKLPPQLETYATHCPMRDRVQRAAQILEQHALGRVVVFGTIKQLDDLEVLLKEVSRKQAAAAAASSTTSKKQRSASSSGIIVRSLAPSKDNTERAAQMADFNAKVANVLLCSDRAARGLDFLDVDVVMMLNLPSHTMAAECFVHRAGRTARVGKPGKCLVLYDEVNERLVIDAITTTNHVTFRKMVALEGSTTARTFLQLRVKRPSSTVASAPAIKTPQEVLEKELGDLVSLVSDQEPINESTVKFSVPMERSHEVIKKLWKYDVKEVKQ